MLTPPYHPPVKYSVTIKGHQTSISLEPLFWDMLRAAAAEMELPLNELIGRIDNERLASSTPSGLAGAIRIWLVQRLV
jgi:predicted DNA-binding ribbon-helix-helix protein